MIPHVLGCSCNKCCLPRYSCPFCGNGEVNGQYSCIEPYEFFWEIGLGDAPVEALFCHRCGRNLPKIGIHPDANRLEKRKRR